MSGTPAGEAADAGEASADDNGSEPPAGALAPRGRRTSVRNRLLLGLLASAVAVLMAGVPVVHQAVQDLNHSQRLVSEADFGQRAVSLSHALAEERDALTVSVALATPSAATNPDGPDGDQPGAGPDGAAEPEGAADGAAPVELVDEDLARVDRRIDELRADAPDELVEQLDTVPTTRDRVREGGSSPEETYHAYTVVLDELAHVTRAVHRHRPERAHDPSAEALPDLARAVEAAAASRTLLVAALSGTGPQEELTDLARRAHAREAAALDDFAATVDEAGLDRYHRTVAGTSVDTAEAALDRLTAESSLTEEARQAAPEDLDATLAARLELQRGALATLAGTQREALTEVRDGDVTALQLRSALLGVALLLALGVGVHTARSLTRPLAAVRLGSRRLAEDPAGQQPVRYTGRDDEFATVVAAVNELHARAVELHQQGVRATESTGDLHSELESLRGEQQDLVERMAAQTGLMHTTLLYHARRSLDLAGEQLTVIDRLEEHETDPDRLATLFALDHLAARMRRHSENVLLLTGVEISAPPPAPVPLVDVAFGALSEAARYELVDVDQRMPAVRVTQPAARDLGHLLAELLDNATASAPPGTRVRMAGTSREDGVTVSVSDDGPGLDRETLATVNAQLAEPAELPPASDSQRARLPRRTPAGAQDASTGESGQQGPPVGMGLYTVARLAARHGLRPRLVARPDGGLRADVEIPAALVRPAGAVAPLGGSGWLDGAAPPAGATRHGSGTGAGNGLPLQRSGSDAGAGTGDQLPPAGGGPEAGPGAPAETATGGFPAVGQPAPAGPATGGPGHASFDAARPTAPGGPAHGPDPHGGTTDRGGPASPPPAPAGGQATTPGGLPIRVPAAALGGHDELPAARPPAEGGTRSGAGPVDPDELRRRLGGFQRGAREGHQDAESAGPPGEEEMHS